MEEMGSSLVQRISFEQTKQVADDGALFAQRDGLGGPGERMIVGQVVYIGTGVVEVLDEARRPVDTGAVAPSREVVLPLGAIDDARGPVTEVVPSLASAIAAAAREREAEDAAAAASAERAALATAETELHPHVTALFSQAALALQRGTYVELAIACTLTPPELLRLGDAPAWAAVPWEPTREVGYMVDGRVVTTVLEYDRLAHGYIAKTHLERRPVHTGFGSAGAFPLQLTLTTEHAVDMRSLPLTVSTLEVREHLCKTLVKDGLRFLLRQEWTGATHIEAEEAQCSKPPTTHLVMEVLDARELVNDRCGIARVMRAWRDEWETVCTGGAVVHVPALPMTVPSLADDLARPHKARRPAKPRSAPATVLPLSALTQHIEAQMAGIE
jgi:hypothetical protein